MSKRLVINIEGLVQGVSFRIGALRMARRLGLTGFVRNEGDGSLLIEVEGQESELDQFVNWCRIGPPLAEVSRITTTESEPVGATDFNIL